MQYNKLVRDNIPEIIATSGDQAVVHIANAVEYKERLYEKLEEEVVEFLVSGEIEELADIIEVVRSLAIVQGSSYQAVEKIRQEKNKQRGGFEKKIILEQVE